jgi:hypothetical protein
MAFHKTPTLTTKSHPLRGFSSLIDWPLNRISLPQCSARSSHRGFLFSIRAILVVVQFEFLRLFKLFKPFTKRHLEGRKRAPRFQGSHSRPLFGENGQISGRVALRDLVFNLPKQEVPRPYSGAEDGAPSSTGARDDDLFDKDRH